LVLLERFQDEMPSAAGMHVDRKPMLYRKRKLRAVAAGWQQGAEPA
jgi:hypothetical protein